MDHTTPSDRLVRINGIIPEKLPIGKSTFWLWVKQGKMPPPVKLSPRVSAWWVSEIDAAIARLDQAAGR
ncbi:helix-turn-helix transcriptional regulator [Desulfonatronum lacustre]|uniref:helix-turn-helix transcriptional regulator n=1 Tax=Desulfonatronum lacustre TaxID=66849 RepID=UPI0004909F75